MKDGGRDGNGRYRRARRQEKRRHRRRPWSRSGYPHGPSRRWRRTDWSRAPTGDPCSQLESGLAVGSARPGPDPESPKTQDLVPRAPRDPRSVQDLGSCFPSLNEDHCPCVRCHHLSTHPCLTFFSPALNRPPQVHLACPGPREDAGPRSRAYSFTFLRNIHIPHPSSYDGTNLSGQKAPACNRSTRSRWWRTNTLYSTRYARRSAKKRSRSGRRARGPSRGRWGPGPGPGGRGSLSRDTRLSDTSPDVPRTPTRRDSLALSMGLSHESVKASAGSPRNRRVPKRRRQRTTATSRVPKGRQPLKTRPLNAVPTHDRRPSGPLRYPRLRVPRRDSRLRLGPVPRRSQECRSKNRSSPCTRGPLSPERLRGST